MHVSQSELSDVKIPFREMKQLPEVSLYPLRWGGTTHGS